MPETKCGFDDQAGISGSELLIQFGPTLLVNIGFDSAWKITNPATIPLAATNNVEALVDTGATVSCIDDQLAIDLKLPIIDKRPLGGAGGELMATIYLAQIYVPALGRTIYGDFAGVHLKAGGQVHQALLGRTFLQFYTMTYDGQTGTVILKSV